MRQRKGKYPLKNPLKKTNVLLKETLKNALNLRRKNLPNLRTCFVSLKALVEKSLKLCPEIFEIIKYFDTSLRFSRATSRILPAVDF